MVNLDEIRVKISAPKRVENNHKRCHIVRMPAVEEVEVTKTAQDLMETNVAIEESWEKGLQSRLLELDPVFGEEIFNAYKQEKDRYSRELETVVKEHQESEELDHLIDELDMAHQQKLQDIFGPYFEDLRDLQSTISQ